MFDSTAARPARLAPAPGGKGSSTSAGHALHNSVIESLGVYLPPEIASTTEILAGCGKISRFKKSMSRFEQRTGIKNRRLAADTEPASEMAAKAIQKCLAVSSFQPADIDLLLCCSISRYQAPNDYIYEPAISLGLTARFGFRNALALDIANGCAGMFTAISIADSFIKAGLIRAALIVSGEHITDLMKTAQQELDGYADPRFACLTLGDAGAALILTQGSGVQSGFQALELYTVAQYSEYCIAKPTERDHGGIIMHTESTKMIDAAENHVIPDTVRALDALQWGKDELDHIISHQTSQRAIDTLYEVNRLSRREILHEGNVINNLSERGNTATTSHFVALWDNIHNGRIRSGHRLLFAVQGSGMTIGTAAYTFDDLPDRVRRHSSNGHGSPAGLSAGRARSVVRCGTPRVRIESVGTAECGSQDSGMTLAQHAMEACLAESSYSKDDIELLIYAGVSRDDFIGEPAIAALIAGRFRMNDAGGYGTGRKTFAFDVCNGSIGFLNACYLSAGMIQSGQLKTAMIVAAEIEPNAGHPEWDQQGIAPMASAVILDNSPGGSAGFGHAVFDAFTDHIGAYSSRVLMSAGASRMYITRHPELEAIYLQSIPETVQEVLKNEGVSMADIKVILPPQISNSLLPRLADALHVDACRFVQADVDGSSLSSSSVACMFSKARKDRGLVAGDVGLMISVGSGLQVGAAVYYF